MKVVASFAHSLRRIAALLLVRRGIRGRVRQPPRKSEATEPFNYWRAGTLLLVAFAILPFLIALIMVYIAIKLAFVILFSFVFGNRNRGGFGGGVGGGQNFFDHLLFHQLLSKIFERKPMPVYHYLVEAGSEIVEVRQEQEFISGAIYQGHEVELWGSRRGGTLWIKGGRNLTTGARLFCRPNLWKGAFLIAAVAAGAGLIVLFASAGLSAL